jgi:hypothetical protein
MQGAENFQVVIAEQIGIWILHNTRKKAHPDIVRGFVTDRRY